MPVIAPDGNNQIVLNAQVARYLLKVTTKLISKLFGHIYDPSSGQFLGPQVENPCLYDNVDRENIPFNAWVGTVVSILKLVATIFHNEVENMPDYDNYDSESIDEFPGEL